MIVLLSACAGINPNSSGSVQTAGGPVSKLAPVPSSGDGAGLDPGALPIGAYPSTNPGGYYSILQRRTLALDSSESMLGFAVIGDDFLMLKRVSLGGGIQRWKVLTTPTQPGTGVATWTVLCDWLGDGSSRLGFSVDASYYYLPGGIASDPYHEQYLRRFKRADCSEVAPLDTAQDLNPTSNLGILGSLSAGKFHIARNNPQNQVLLKSWSLTTGAWSSRVLTTQLGGTQLSYAYSAFVGDDAIWVLAYSTLWRLDLQGNGGAWAALPGGSDLLLQGALAVVSIGGGQVVIITLSGGGLVRTFLDVSRF